MRPTLAVGYRVPANPRPHPDGPERGGLLDQTPLRVSWPTPRSSRPAASFGERASGTFLDVPHAAVSTLSVGTTATTISVLTATTAFRFNAGNGSIAEAKTRPGQRPRSTSRDRRPSRPHSLVLVARHPTASHPATARRPPGARHTTPSGTDIATMQFPGDTAPSPLGARQHGRSRADAGVVSGRRAARLRSNNGRGLCGAEAQTARLRLDTRTPDHRQPGRRPRRRGADTAAARVPGDMGRALAGPDVIGRFLLDQLPGCSAPPRLPGPSPVVPESRCARRRNTGEEDVAVGRHRHRSARGHPPAVRPRGPADPRGRQGPARRRAQQPTRSSGGTGVSTAAGSLPGPTSSPSVR